MSRTSFLPSLVTLFGLAAIVGAFPARSPAQTSQPASQPTSQAASQLATESATPAKPSAAAPEGERRRRGRRRRMGSDNSVIRRAMQKNIDEGIAGSAFREEAPKVGEEAPDFTLTPLKFYDFKTAETDITEENAGLLYEPVSLSSFKGKKPVVLIFGSYT